MPTEDLLFVLAALVGGGLLLVTVALDGRLGGMVDAIRLGPSMGAVSLIPPLLAFVAMFGVGGIVAGQALALRGLGAAAVGAVVGLIGFLVALRLYRTMQRGSGPRPFSIADMVGRQGVVVSAIPEGGSGTVSVHLEAEAHEVSATSSMAATPGTAVKVVATSGTGVVVERLTPQPIAMPIPTGDAAGSGTGTAPDSGA